MQKIESKTTNQKDYGGTNKIDKIYGKTTIILMLDKF